MEEREALKAENERLRKGIRYLIEYLKRSEVMFYCDFKHDGPADMAFQRFMNIRMDAVSILNPDDHDSWYRNLLEVIERNDKSFDENMAALDKKIDEEDACCRKERWHR